MSAPLWDRDGSQTPKPGSGNRRAAIFDADRIAARRVLWGVWLVGLGVAFVLTRGPRSSGPPQQNPTEVRDLAPIGPSGGESSSGYGYPGPVFPHEGGRGGPPRRPALHYTFRRLLTLGDPAPGGGVHAGDFEISDLNNAGQAPIVNEEPGTREAGGGEALFVVMPERVQRIIKPGAATPEGTHYGGSIWTPQSINNRGQVVWAGELDNGETWTFFYNVASHYLGVIARPGMPAPGGGRFLSGGRQRPVINEVGAVAFVAHVAGPQGAATPGVFLDGSPMEVVARPGTPSPDGSHFTAAEAPAINSAGAIVFHALVQGSEGLGIYRWQRGTIMTIAARGTPVRTSGRPDLPLEQAFYPQIDDRGRVVFLGRTSAGDELYRWSDGAVVTRILGRETRLPGLGILYAGLDRRYPFHLNAGGAVAFLGTVHDQTGVFVWKEGKIEVVALSHIPLPRIGMATAIGNFGNAGFPSYGPRIYGPSGGPPGARASRAPAPNSDARLEEFGPDRAIPRPVPSPSAAREGSAPTRGPGEFPAPAGAPAGQPPGGSAGPIGFGPSGAFGLGISDDGKLLFAATIGGGTHLILATPLTAPRR